MLMTTVDGLWVLQVLSGIEVLAPEIGLRPHLPRSETTAMALSHPAANELRCAGVITADGEIDAAVTEWLTVLSRRDVALLVCVQTPTGPERIVLARLAQWWVTLERWGSVIRLAGAGVATSERDAARVIGTQIDRLCGRLRPADLRPFSIETERIQTGLRSGLSLTAILHGRLNGRELDPGQVRVLAAATDPRECAQASLVAIHSGERPLVTDGVVTIIDTPHGRVLSEHIDRDGQAWLVVGPGSASAITRAVNTLLRRTPAQADWYRYRKVV